MCVCVVCILYCHTISWNIPMVFAYSLTQLAPFSLGLHSSSKLSSPEQHPWSVILQGMQRTLSKESRLILFSSIMRCKFTSVTWYRFLLTIYTRWITFKLRGPVAKNTQPHLWWQFIHCIFHLPEMYNLCTDTTRCLPGSPAVPPWKTWGCRDVLPRCRWKVEI